MRSMAVWCLLAATALAVEPGELFQEAENLARNKRFTEAMAKVEAAVVGKRAPKPFLTWMVG